MTPDLPDGDLPGHPDPAGDAARRLLDRSLQAARFLDLTRRRAELGSSPIDDVDDPDEADDLALPLIARLERAQIDIVAGTDASAEPADDDIRIDHWAVTTFRAEEPAAPTHGRRADGFTLDDDGDVFGDGSEFAAEPPFGWCADD